MSRLVPTSPEAAAHSGSVAFMQSLPPRPPLQWPMPDRPSLSRWRLGGAVLLTGTVVALIATRWRGSVGNPIVIAEQGGPYKVLQFLRVRLPFGPRLAAVATIDRPHATLAQWIMERLLIAPASDKFAVEESELIASSPGADMAVTLLTMDGHQLFFTTDNGFPATSYSGIDPAAPLALRQAQEIADADWEAEKHTNPAAPRPVITGRFSDDDGRGLIRVSGWLANGDMALAGRAPLRFTRADGSSWMSDDLEDWWGVVSPVPPGDHWAFSARGAGALPPAYTRVPMPPKQRDVMLNDGQIVVDGIVESGFAPILALDGPYRPVNG